MKKDDDNYDQIIREMKLAQVENMPVLGHVQGSVSSESFLDEDDDEQPSFIGGHQQQEQHSDDGGSPVVPCSIRANMGRVQNNNNDNNNNVGNNNSDAKVHSKMPYYVKQQQNLQHSSSRKLRQQTAAAFFCSSSSIMSSSNTFMTTGTTNNVDTKTSATTTPTATATAPTRRRRNSNDANSTSRPPPARLRHSARVLFSHDGLVKARQRRHQARQTTPHHQSVPGAYAMVGFNGHMSSPLDHEEEQEDNNNNDVDLSARGYIQNIVDRVLQEDDEEEQQGQDNNNNNETAPFWMNSFQRNGNSSFKSSSSCPPRIIMIWTLIILVVIIAGVSVPFLLLGGGGDDDDITMMEMWGDNNQDDGKLISLSSPLLDWQDIFAVCDANRHQKKRINILSGLTVETRKRLKRLVEYLNITTSSSNDDDDEGPLFMGSCASSDTLALVAMALQLSPVELENMTRRHEMNQYFILASLFFATQGLSSWKHSTHWLSNNNNETLLSVDNNETTISPTCAWYGVKCNSEGILTGLILPSNGLKGTIPKSLFVRQDELAELNLHHNDITGKYLLEHVAKYGSKITDFDLFPSLISGTLPIGFAQLARLTNLKLSSHNIEGTIPTEWGQMTNLESLYLGSIGLDGNIPTELGRMNRLNDLFVVGTFHGTFPTEILNSPSLEFLRVESKGLLLGQLTPSMFENNTNWQSLDLSGEFDGSIPTEIGRLSNLKSLVMLHNELTGSLPTELGLCTSLQVLNLRTNKIRGQIPSELAQLSDTLLHINLSANYLSGAIPTEFARLTQLQVLSLELQKTRDCGARGSLSLVASSSSSSSSSSAGERAQNSISNNNNANANANSNNNPSLLCDDGLQGSIPTALCELSSLESLSLTCGNVPWSTCPQDCCICSHG